MQPCFSYAWWEWKACFSIIIKSAIRNGTSLAFTMKNIEKGKERRREE